MADNAFDMVRKIRHLPGLKLTATLDPTLISKRVKTAAQKMLRSGVLTSGYRSKSRILAEQMLNDEGRVAPVSSHAWGVSIADAALLTKEAREQIKELIGAAKLVAHAGSQEEYQTVHINEKYARMLTNLKTTRIGRLSFHNRQLDINMQIAEVVASCRTPLMIGIHNELADKLDSTKPFIINF